VTLAVPAPHPVPAAAGGVDGQLSPATASRLRQAIPENTRRSYDSQYAAFTTWCANAGRSPLPATGETMTEYAAHLIDAARSPGSIEVALSAIRTAHRYAALEPPDTRGARLLIRDYRRARADTGARDRQAPPAVATAIRAMIDTCDPQSSRGRRDRALLLLGFTMMGRRSELSRLDIGDITATGKGLTVRVSRSKTDQAARGRETPILASQVDGDDGCPVAAVTAWIGYLAEQGITAGPLFRPVDRWGHVGTARLGGQAIGRIVKDLAIDAGQNPAMSAHSLRSGGATSAAEAGASRAALAAQGRWNPASPSLDRYVRLQDEWKHNAMRGVAI